MHLHYCLLFLIMGLCNVKAQNTESILLKVRLEPVQVLTIQTKSEDMNVTESVSEKKHRVREVCLTSTFGYTLWVIKKKKQELLHSYKIHKNASMWQNKGALEHLTLNGSISAPPTQKQQYTIYYDEEKEDKKKIKDAHSDEIPHYFFTMISQ